MQELHAAKEDIQTLHQAAAGAKDFVEKHVAIHTSLTQDVSEAQRLLREARGREQKLQSELDQLNTHDAKLKSALEESTTTCTRIRTEAASFHQELLASRTRVKSLEVQLSDARSEHSGAASTQVEDLKSKIHR